MRRGRPCGRQWHARRRMEEAERGVDKEEGEGGEEESLLYHEGGVKVGEYHCSDIQVAINEGNTREDAFFMIRLGKSSTALPFQQPIPVDFARDHQTLALEKVTLEGPCGRVWSVVVRQYRGQQQHVLRFGKGWRQFAVENHLREGYRLLFTLTLITRSRFLVQFFDHLGKSHVLGFPPLPLPLPGPGSHSHSQPVISDRQHGGDPQSSSATPVKPLRKPATTLAQHAAAFNCNQAGNQGKSIQRHGLPQLQSEVLQLQATVSPEDMSTALEGDTSNEWNRSPLFDGLEQAQQGPRAVGEGKSYIYIDLDDDDDDNNDEDEDEDDDEDDEDDLSYLPARLPARLRAAATKQKLPKPVTSMRDASEVIKLDSEFCAPGPVDEICRHVDEKDEIRRHVDEDDGLLTITTPTCSGEYLERRRGPVTRTTVVRKRPSRRQESSSVQPPVSSSSAPPFGATWRGYQDVEETCGVEGGFVRAISRAMRLLQQQGCTKFSEIVCHCSRLQDHISDDQERSRVVNEAEKFANALQNANFLVVMREAQVYHDFHLAIPQAMVEATGTMGANKVKVFLSDSEKSIYVVNWEWQESCNSTLLSSEGWARFALDHAMEEGDVCVFELMDSGPGFLCSVVFRVHIFRVTDAAAVHHHSSDTTLVAAGGPGQTSLRKPLEMNSSSEGELKHSEGTKRPIADVHRLRLQRMLLKARNLQPWSKIIQPRMQGRRALRQF